MRVKRNQTHLPNLWTFKINKHFSSSGIIQVVGVGKTYKPPRNFPAHRPLQTHIHRTNSGNGHAPDHAPVHSPIEESLFDPSKVSKFLGHNVGEGENAKRFEGRKSLSYEPRSSLRVCKAGTDPVGLLHNFPWRPKPFLYQDTRTTLLPRNPHDVDWRELPSTVLYEAWLGQVIVSNVSNRTSKSLERPDVKRRGEMLSKRGDLTNDLTPLKAAIHPFR